LHIVVPAIVICVGWKKLRDEMKWWNINNFIHVCKSNAVIPPSQFSASRVLEHLYSYKDMKNYSITSTQHITTMHLCCHRQCSPVWCNFLAHTTIFKTTTLSSLLNSWKWCYFYCLVCVYGFLCVFMGCTNGVICIED
jgi:hypothetical protein